MFRSYLLVFLLSPTLPALAVYKCEANGKVTYTDAPCLSAQVLDIERHPPAAAAQAIKQAAQEKDTLKQLESDRRRQEAQEEKLQRRASKSQAAARKKCANLARRKKWADEDTVAATGKAVEKARRKARRLAEQHEDECVESGPKLSIAG
jgi:hypothetical protein